MGMTIWVNYLGGDNVTSHESDKSAMYRHIARLDKICGKLGVAQLSSFLDTTDLANSMAASDTAGESGWDLMVKQGRRLVADKGLAVLNALIYE